MKILIAIVGIFISWLIWVKNAMGFTNADINTATFSATNIVPEYKDGGTRQWLTTLADNTAYNNRNSDKGMFIANELFTANALGSDRTYDTGRNYIGKYVNVQIFTQNTSWSFPWQRNTNATPFSYEVVLLTTTFQALPFSSGVWIRALNGGGFTLRLIPSPLVDKYLIGFVTELRAITGA